LFGKVLFNQFFPANIPTFPIARAGDLYLQASAEIERLGYLPSIRQGCTDRASQGKHQGAVQFLAAIRSIPAFLIFSRGILYIGSLSYPHLAARSFFLQLFSFAQTALPNGRITCSLGQGTILTSQFLQIIGISLLHCQSSFL
jgi:hypothetical protein